MKKNKSFIIQQAELGKKKINPFFAVALTLFFILIGGQLLGEILLFPIQFLKDSPNSFLRNIFLSSVEVSYNLMAVVLLFLWIRFMEKRPIHSIGFTKEGALKKYLKGLFLGLVLISIHPLILVLTNNGMFELQNVSTTLIGTIIMYLIAFIIQGAAEEIIFRGWLLPIITVRTNMWIGIVISSLLFGSLHLFNSGITFLSFLGICLFGFFAAFYVLKEGSLWLISGLHSIWNWGVTCIYGIGILGDSAGETSLFKSSFTGPDIITGGTYGMEGSIITSIMLVLASLVILRKLNNNSDIESYVIDVSAKNR